MTKKQTMVLFIAMAIALLAYGLTIAFEWATAQNGFAPLPVFISGFLMVGTGIQKKTFRACWFLLSAGLFLWGITDLVWLFFENGLGIDPSDILGIAMGYSMSNVFMVAAALVYFFMNFKKWHKVQLLVDSTVVVVVSVILLTQTLFDGYTLEAVIALDNMVSLVAIVSNVVMLTIVLIMLSSVRIKKTFIGVKVLALFYLLFVLGDFYYYYTYYSGVYEANSWIDWYYAFALAGLGLSAALDRLYNEGEQGAIFTDQMKGIKRLNCIFILFVFSTGLYYGQIIGFLVWAQILVLLLVHQLLNAYVQMAIKNESLLKLEKASNLRLEQLVWERTSALRKVNEDLEKISKTDGLTQMFNRRHFAKRVDLLIQEGAKPFSVLYMDLDHFKVINDLHGHEMGDRVLKAVANRFQSIEQVGVLFARIGGDEFGALVMHDATDQERVVALCEALIEKLNDPITIDRYRFSVGISIGVACFPKDAQTRDQLFKFADLAMYQGKRNKNQGTYVFYNEAHGIAVERKSLIEMRLKMANYHECFELHFQPQFKVPTLELVGVEALLRWRDAELGWVPPNEFIPVAEEINEIINIGKWVMESAFTQIAKWNAVVKKPLSIGINLSPLQLETIDFIPYLEAQMAEKKINPQWIDFEITENSAMRSSVQMEAVFSKLFSKGIMISMDDFGTGYSSLSYIKRFDIDRLKIAKELIDNIVDGQEERIIIGAIIMMAKGMGLGTIAEGVESKAQLDVLVELGCEAIQGYYLSKPLTQSEFESRYIN